MMGQWNQMNPQFMMQPHMFDFQRFRQRQIQQDNEQQQQWWENYWNNWGKPDSAMIRRMEENRKRFHDRDSIWQQRRQQFAPQSQYGPQFGIPQFGGPQFGPQQQAVPQFGGPQFGRPYGNPYGGGNNR